MSSNVCLLDAEEISESDYQELSQKSSQSVFNYEDDSSDPDFEDSEPFTPSDCSSQGFSQVKTKTKTAPMLMQNLGLFTGIGFQAGRGKVFWTRQN